MVFQEMVPWRRERRNVNVREDDFPLNMLQRRMNRMFDDFFGDFGDFGLRPQRDKSAFLPRMDISETEKGITVTAELAGMEQKDVDITLQDNVLTIHGEKKVERDEKNERCCLTERSYGTFNRSIALPTDVDEDKIEASFKNGVLTVNLPKAPQAQPKAKKIEIKTQ